MENSFLPMPSLWWNKEFLGTDYPRDRAVEVFRRFHFGLKAKNRNSVFCLTQNRKYGFDLSKGEVKSETPWQSPKEFFSIKMRAQGNTPYYHYLFRLSQIQALLYQGAWLGSHKGNLPGTTQLLQIGLGTECPLHDWIVFLPQSPGKDKWSRSCGLRHLAFDETVVMRLNQAGIATEPIRTDELTQKKFTFFTDPDNLPLEIYEG